MAVTAHENMNMIAVGYKDGSVVLIRGNITRDRMSRQKIVHQEETAGVYVTGRKEVVFPPHSSSLVSSFLLISHAHFPPLFILSLFIAIPLSLSPPFSPCASLDPLILLFPSTLLSLSLLHHFSFSFSCFSLPFLLLLHRSLLLFVVAILGLGFRQVGQVTYLMVATTAAVYAILASDNDKEVWGREGELDRGVR